MKKIFALIIISSMLVLGGCSSGDKSIIWGDDMVSCDVILTDGDMYSLPVPFAYADDKGEIIVEVKKINGENTEQADITVVTDDAEIISNTEYKGYRLGLIGLQVWLKGTESVCINSIDMEINGEETSLVFDEALKYTPGSNSMAIPLTSPLIMDGSRNGEDLSFTLQIDDKLSIVDYSTKGNYAVENAVCSVNYSYIDGIACDVDKNDEIRYEMDFSRKDEHIYFSVNNLIINYVSDNGEKGQAVFTFNTTLMNEEEFNMVLKKIVDGDVEQK